MRGKQGCQQQDGQGAGWDNMAKIAELLINVVIHEQAKAADWPDPKKERSRVVALNVWRTRFIWLPAERQSLSCQRQYGGTW